MIAFSLMQQLSHSALPTRGGGGVSQKLTIVGPAGRYFLLREGSGLGIQDSV